MRLVVPTLVLVALLAATLPLETELSKSAPDRPAAAEIGAGRLGSGVMTGAMRPLLLNYLWIRADELSGRGRQDQLLTLYRTMRALYPNNPRAQEHLGWHLAFNMKHDAPTEDAAWGWAREGLEMLRGTKEGRPTIAFWFGWQAGLPPLNLRYAGEPWRTERRQRRRAEKWFEESYGKRLGRFQAALSLLDEPTGFEDRLVYAAILRTLVYEEWLAAGYAPHAEEAWRIHSQLADIFEKPDTPGMLHRIGLEQAAEYRSLAAEIKSLHDGTHVAELANLDRYETAMALWGIGAHDRKDFARQRKMLAAAESILQRLDAQIRKNAPSDDGYREELELVRAWIAHKEDGTVTRPPLPFD